MLVRIVLDTCTVRNEVHGTGPRLDLQAIPDCQDQLRFSLAGSAFAELLEQLCNEDGGISFADWQNAIPHLNSILDDRWPFVPSGKQLSALTGLQTDLAIDIDGEQRHLQACWRLLTESRSVADLQRGLVYDAPDGQKCQIKLDTDVLEAMNTGERNSWIDYIRKIQAVLPPLGIQSEEDIYKMMEANQGSQPFDSPEMRRKLESVNRMIAKFAALSLKRRDSYDPTTERRRGDAFDLSLLFYVPLPAIICTADQRFVRRLRDTGAIHAKQIVTVDELNQHVTNGTLRGLVSDFMTPDKQFDAWQKGAFSRWTKRKSPLWDDLTDWFAAEPIA